MKKRMKLNWNKCTCKDKCRCGCGKPSCGAVYGLGFIGALIYYLSTATGFWMGVLGVLKALIWPVFLIYDSFRFFGM